MRETLLLDVPHRQVVLTIPKTLRIFFKYRRRLLGELSRVSTPTPEFIRHLELTFVAEKPPPAHVFEQTALMTAEESGEYE